MTSVVIYGLADTTTLYKTRLGVQEAVNRAIGQVVGTKYERLDMIDVFFSIDSSQSNKSSVLANIFISGTLISGKPKVVAEAVQGELKKVARNGVKINVITPAHSENHFV